MIRPLTVLILLGAAGAGLHLYSVKQSTAVLERDLRDILRRTEAARDRSQILRAEWAMLNEPDRLRQVVERHLSLQPMLPSQFVRESDLDRRLAPPVAFAGAPSLFADPTAPDARETVLAGRVPAAPAPAAVPAASAAVTLASAQAPAPRPQVPPAAMAQPAAAPAPAPTPAPTSAPAPRARAVASAEPAAPARPPTPARATTAHTSYARAARPAPTLVSAADPVGGSALGAIPHGDRPLLPPPVPYSAGLVSSANAATVYGGQASR